MCPWFIYCWWQTKFLAWWALLLLDLRNYIVIQLAVSGSWVKFRVTDFCWPRSHYRCLLWWSNRIGLLILCCLLFFSARNWTPPHSSYARACSQSCPSCLNLTHLTCVELLLNWALLIPVLKLDVLFSPIIVRSKLKFFMADG